MDEKTMIITITGMAVTFFLLSVGFISFLTFFFRSKRKSFEAKQEREMQFANEFGKAKVEIKAELLKTVGRDLHDNLGQLLTLATLRLNLIPNAQSSIEFKDTQEALQLAIHEVKHMSKTLVSQDQKSFDFYERIDELTQNLNNIQHLKIHSQLEKHELSISNEESLILFRVIQEFINNSLKHSEGDEISLSSLLEEDTMKIILKDNGKGFNLNERSNTSGQGLNNMFERLKLIGVEHQFTSQPGMGTKLNLTITKSRVDA